MLTRMDPAIIERKERNFQFFLGFHKKKEIIEEGKKGNISKMDPYFFFLLSR